jgi:hypothetical protein
LEGLAVLQVLLVQAELLLLQELGEQVLLEVLLIVLGVLPELLEELLETVDSFQVVEV